MVPRVGGQSQPNRGRWTSKIIASNQTDIDTIRDRIRSTIPRSDRTTNVSRSIPSSNSTVTSGTLEFKDNIMFGMILQKMSSQRSGRRHILNQEEAVGVGTEQSLSRPTNEDFQLVNGGNFFSTRGTRGMMLSQVVNEV